VPEELALDQLAAERRAVHLDHRLAAARAPEVERVGDQLLARPALAADEHGDVGVGHLGDGLEDARHRGTAADDLLEPERALDLGEEAAVVAPEQHVLHHAADDDAQLVVVEGLREVVLGPELHRLHGDLLRAVRRDHDRRGVRIGAAQMLEHAHAADAVHAQVGDDDVEGAGVDVAHRLLAAFGGLDLIALASEKALQREAHRFLVVDDQNPALHLRLRPVTAAAAA
jgi:hypothetical protein